MINLARLAKIVQADRHAGDQSVATLRRLQQHGPTIGTALPLVEFQHHRLGKHLWKQQRPVVLSSLKRRPFLATQTLSHQHVVAVWAFRVCDLHE